MVTDWNRFNSRSAWAGPCANNACCSKLGLSHVLVRITTRDVQQLLVDNSIKPIHVLLQ
jgi:hypothetical protein